MGRLPHPTRRRKNQPEAEEKAPITECFNCPDRIWATCLRRGASGTA